MNSQVDTASSLWRTAGVTLDQRLPAQQQSTATVPSLVLMLHPTKDRS